MRANRPPTTNATPSRPITMPAGSTFTEEAPRPSFVRHLRHHVVVHHRHVAMHVDLILDEFAQ